MTINKIIYSMLAVVLIAMVFWGVTSNSKSDSVPNAGPIKQVHIGGKVLDVNLANTPALQEQGLSGVASLNKGTGMLFVFGEMGSRPFWMKDMNFPIDIIWIDENFKIVYIKSNATPESYPEIFVPTVEAKYVLEVVSGFATENKIKEGETVLFTF